MESCESRRCAAPTPKGQCPNFTDNNRLHCSEHYKKAVKLYNKYKKHCLQLDNYRIEKISQFDNLEDKIKYLNKYYTLCLRVKNGRKEHRDNWFIPELFDAPHNFQIELVDKWIEDVRDKLLELYEEQRKKELSPPTLTIEEEENSILPIVVEEKILQPIPKKLKKKKKKSNNLTGEKDNINITIDKCINAMASMIGSNKYQKLFHFICLIRELRELDYFSPYFAITKCRCRQLYEIDITSYPLCDYNNMRDFLLNSRHDALKYLLKILTTCKHKLLPIAEDYKKYWMKFGGEIINEDFYFEWTGEQLRLGCYNE